MAEYAREMGKVQTFRTLGMQARWKDNLDLEDTAVLRDLASASGLDSEKAVAAASSHDYMARVDAFKAEAARMGITGIPTFIIGTERVVGCQPYQVLADALLRASAPPRKKHD